MRTLPRLGLVVALASVLAGFEPAGRSVADDAELSLVLAAGVPRTLRVRLEATELEHGATYSTGLGAEVDPAEVEVEVVRRGGDCDDAPRCEVDYDVVLTAADDIEAVVALRGWAQSLDARGGCGARKQPSLVVVTLD
jgi:hypothetical protein